MDENLGWGGGREEERERNERKKKWRKKRRRGRLRKKGGEKGREEGNMSRFSIPKVTLNLLECAWFPKRVKGTERKPKLKPICLV